MFYATFFLFFKRKYIIGYIPDLKFLKLKDVTEGYLKPCVMDVKIGKQTWEPNATLEKRKAEDVIHLSKLVLYFIFLGDIFLFLFYL